jgi:tRNA G46 methylase TrmB
MGEVLLEQMNGKLSSIVSDGLVKGHHLSSWQYQPPLSSTTNVEDISQDPCSHPTLCGPPRVLDLGCGSGSWCFMAKAENPNWIIHGLDDTNHWLCVNKEFDFK